MTPYPKWLPEWLAELSAGRYELFALEGRLCAWLVVGDALWLYAFDAIPETRPNAPHHCVGRMLSESEGGGPCVPGCPVRLLDAATVGRNAEWRGIQRDYRLAEELRAGSEAMRPGLEALARPGLAPDPFDDGGA